MREEIIKVLMDRFSNVYCTTCINKGNDDICISCHRKSINWTCSAEYAEKVADEILKAIWAFVIKCEVKE